MDKKQYMTPEAEAFTVAIERCILSVLPDNQNRGTVEDATPVDGAW